MAYTAEAGHNRFTADGQQMSYFGDGSLATANGHSFDYTAEGLLRSIDGYSTGSYLYNAEGQRTFATRLDQPWNGRVDNTASEYVYLNGQPMAEYNIKYGGDWHWADNIYADGQKVARIEQANGSTPAATHYYLADHLGTTQMELSSTGAVEWQGYFEPFGKPIDGSSAYIGPHTPNGPRYKFTGKERDNESGLDYFGARYYASNMGRWMSPDWSAKEEPVPYAKLDNPQSLNLYAYVGNNPLNRADADGHDPQQQTPPPPPPPPTTPPPSRPALGQPGGPQLNPNSQECKDLAKKIDNTASKIIDRTLKIEQNPLNLPQTAPAGSPPGASVDGHIQIKNELIDTLGKQADLYNNKCGGGPPPSPVTAPAPIMSRSTATTVRNVSAGVAFVGIMVLTFPEGPIIAGTVTAAAAH